MVKIKRLIGKTKLVESNVALLTFLKLLVVFAVSTIQLPSRKGARYGFNVPSCYLKTKPKYEFDKKHFSG